jgi:DNA-binding winged helix-turn-helix (wHTH) protein/Tfp pilus assembly protein PilF
MEPEAQVYEFDEFRLEPGSRSLSRAGRVVQLTPKAFDTLLHLVRHQGSVVGKDELIRAVWNDTVVEENSLNQNISALRKALGENAKQNRYVVTIPGRGYRFVPNVHMASAAAPTIRTLAVLPFKPLVAGHRDDALEMGIADTLIAQIGSSRETVVRPLSSVRRYTALDQDPLAAGRELAVESVLDGSIQRDGPRIRVTVRLLRVEDGASLWMQKFDQEFTDVLGVQDTIAEKVATQLALRVNREERKKLTQHYTENVEAYHQYLRGRYYVAKLTLPDIRKSIEYFRQAIDIDPTYGLAYAWVAEAYRRLPITSDVPPKEAFPKTKAAATKALEIDPGLADAHTALAFAKFWFDWDWSGAEEEIKRAIALSPNSGEVHHGYGVLLSILSRYDEAVAEGQRAVELDPLSLIVNANLGVFFHFAGRNEEAHRQIERTFEIDANFWVAHLVDGKIRARNGEYSKAAAAFAKARQFSQGNSEAISMEAYALALAGENDRARNILKDLEALSLQRHVPSNSMAIIHAALGENDATFACLDRACEERDVRLTFLSADPKWDLVRADPRFSALVRRIGLKDRDSHLWNRNADSRII